ncbi:NAD-dependent epimerase/dehydratase family protein [Candidatus Actinomarina]|nr:NAD-dependent epimerase/dehydratase family protein [Candidatus Actinomarina sp.]
MGIHVVTGCAGFIGKHIAIKLLTQGHEVIGFDNFLLGRKENIDYLQKFNSKFKFHEIDLSTQKSSNQIIDLLAKSDIDTVWHFAANSDIRGFMYGYERDLKNTFLTTLNILEASKHLNIKDFIFASSSAVVGSNDNKITEDTGPLLPESYYGAMKMASEGLISSSKSYFLNNYVIFRFPNVVGPDSTHGVMYDFTNKLTNNPKEMEVLGNGEQKKPYLYIDDLIEGIFHIKSLTIRDRVYNLTPVDTGVKVKRIAELFISKLSPKTVPVYENNDKGWQGDIPNYFYCYEKMLETGWRPKFSSEQAINKTLDEILETISK